MKTNSKMKLWASGCVFVMTAIASMATSPPMRPPFPMSATAGVSGHTLDADNPAFTLDIEITVSRAFLEREPLPDTTDRLDVIFTTEPVGQSEISMSLTNDAQEVIDSSFGVVTNSGQPCGGDNCIPGQTTFSTPFLHRCETEDCTVRFVAQMEWVSGDPVYFEIDAIAEIPVPHYARTSGEDFMVTVMPR